MNIELEITKLQQMTVPELRERYADVTGEATTSRHKQYLMRRILWKLQAAEEGGVSERAKNRARELAATSDIRLTPPRARAVNAPERTVVGRLDLPDENRLPPPSSILTRKYKGETIQVRVLPKGFDYNGEIYRSLSAVARAVTGTHWNGYSFFNLGRKGDDGNK